MIIGVFGVVAVCITVRTPILVKTDEAECNADNSAMRAIVADKWRRQLHEL